MMKTKQWFFRCAAVFAALASALAGCDRNEGTQGKVTIPDDNNIKFVIKVADKPAGTEGADGQTRALKSGWANGDMMVVFFGDTSANSVLVVYDDETEKWDRVAASVTELAASGTAHALHAGGGFSYDEGGFTDIEGDLLYDDAGTYIYDSFSETVTLTLTMERGLTSVVKMESPDGLPGNMDWRLAGEGLWVQTEYDLAASNFSSGFTFAEVLEGLFSESDASTDIAATPDEIFTTDEMAVFHVWDKTTTSGTSFEVYKTDAPGTRYSRTYAEDLTSGGSVLLAGPSSGDEEDEWSVYSTTILVTPSALTVTAPVAGEAPSGSITTESVQFTATMEWITEDGEAVEGNFAPSTVYTADICLTAAAGYTFKDGVGDYDSLTDIAGFTVNGIAPTAFTSVSEDGKELFFDVDFSVAADGPLKLLDSSIDPTSTLVEYTASTEQWQRLLSSDFGFMNDMVEITNTVYSKFDDDFDFIFYVLNTPQNNDITYGLGFSGVNISVSNGVQGLGRNTYSNSEQWGSAGKLKSVMYFPFDNAIVLGPSLHELAHNWAAFIKPDRYNPDNTVDYGGHWTVTNGGGQLGGFKYIRTVEENSGGVTGKTLYQASFYPDTNEDGSFVRGFGDVANGGNGLPFSDIELYLMGMKSADELREADFTFDVYSGNDYSRTDPYGFDKGYFWSTTKTSHTIDDIIELNGSRVPDAASSQKSFKILTVVLSQEGQTANNYAEIIEGVSWFAGGMDDYTYGTWLYNFQQATYGQGTLVVDGVKNSLKPQTRSGAARTAAPLAPPSLPDDYRDRIHIDKIDESLLAPER